MSLFNRFQSPSYPFTLKDGTLVYKGKESESTKQSKVDGQVKKNAEGLDKVNEQMKEDAKGLDKVDGQEKKGAKGLDKVNGQVKKDAKGLDKVDGQQKKNVKGLVKVDGQQKKNVKGLVKVDGLGKDITITYYIVHHTENVIALYSCSDIAKEPAMAFVAVSSKSIEKKEAKAEVIKARNLLRQIGVKIFRKIPFCKDQGKAPSKKRKRGKKARRRSKKTHVKRRIVKHRSSNNHPAESSGKPTKEGISGEVRANPTTGAKGVGKGENKVEKPSGNSQGEKKTPKDKPKDVGNKSEDKPEEKPKLTD